MGRIFN